MKIDQEIIAEVANARLDPEQAKALLKEIEEQAQLEAEAAASLKEPRQKQQLVIALSDPDGEMKDLMGFLECGFVGWVLSLPEDDDAGMALDRVMRASWEYNLSKKGRRHPVKSVGEACEAVGARFLREQNVAVKTKLPVRVLVTNNRLPEVASDFKEAV